MKTSLFLHYGPGGNAHVEKHVLTKDMAQTIFWDQPRVKNYKNPFNKLALFSADFIQETKSKTIIAHSFGCDILSSLLNYPQINIDKAILISPLKSIPIGIFTLGEVLFRKKPNSELRLALDMANAKISDVDQTAFWGMVTQVASHLDYSASFWHSHEAQKNYETIAGSGPTFDAMEWQTLIQDYLFNNKTSSFDRFNDKKTLAIFGENDPYFIAERDLPYWQNLLGKEQVAVIKHSGHFPHLENRTEFLNIVNNWKD